MARWRTALVARQLPLFPPPGRPVHAMLPHDNQPPAQATAPPAGPDVREVKVKLPVDQVLRLHATRLKSGRNFSQTVSSALTRYFDELRSP